MVDVRELRIGNWVEDASYLSGIHNYRPCTSYDIFCDDIEAFLPIPLTEEILLRCGFEKDYNGFCLSDKMSLSFSITKDGEYLACWLDKSLGIVIKYLHQLQNIFYILNAKELEVQL